MSLIATTIEPDGTVRIFFDCREAEPDRADQLRIARAIEQAAAMTRIDVAAGYVPLAA